jgi:hypothetical protein
VAGRNIELRELVGALLKARRRHDGQIYGASQVDQVLLRQIADVRRDCLAVHDPTRAIPLAPVSAAATLGASVPIVGRRVIGVAAPLVVGSAAGRRRQVRFPQDLGAYLPPELFAARIIRLDDSYKSVI